MCLSDVLFSVTVTVTDWESMSSF